MKRIKKGSRLINVDIKRILVFNPFGIGDVLFSTPLIRNIKDNFPCAAVSYICNKRAYPLLKNNIFIDKVIIFEKDEWRAQCRKSKWVFLKKFISFRKEIKKSKYDVVFDLSMNLQYGLFFKTAGIRKRVGFNFKKRGRFLTHKVNIPWGYRDKHVARYYSGLLKFFDIVPKDYDFDLFIPDETLVKAKEILEKSGIKEGDFLVGVCPGSGDSWGESAYFKRLPPEGFAELSRRVIRELKGKILFLGSESEFAICDAVCKRTGDGPVNLCGKVSLEEFFGLVHLCDFIVTNDGGPFHIAQALKKKAVAFFGPVDEKVYGAYPDTAKCFVFKKDLPCRPCYSGFRFKGCNFDRECLRGIDFREAFSVIRDNKSSLIFNAEV